MKFKTFILTFLMMMSCSISFGQGSLTGSATTEAQLWMHLNDDEIGTISLANDIKITVTCPIPNGKKVTIDLNGHKLFTEEEIYIINNEGKLTITDNSEGKTGTISSTLGIYNGVTPTRTSVTDVKYDRVLTINGGVFNSSSKNGNAATIYNYRGVIKINGGEFYGEHSAITNYGIATIANAYIECLNRDNGAAAIINDFEIAYGENVNIVGIYTTVTQTAYTTGTEPTYLFAELKNGPKYPSLQAALDACTTGDNTINLLFHNSDNATVSQKEGVNITIDGNGYKGKQFEYTGTIYVNGNSRHTGTETLTIQDVNFVTTDNEHDFISCNDGGDPVIRYAHNVTVQNCNFNAKETSTAVVALRFRQSYNINVVNSKFTNLHSAMWATGTSGIAFDKITATNCKEGGISVGTSTSVSVKNSTIAGAKYGVRADGSGDYRLTVESSELTAEVPVIVRNTTGDYNLTVKEGATLASTNGGPQVVVTKGSDNADYVVPTSDVNVTLYDNVTSTFGLTAKIGNAFYATLQDAVDNAKTGETVTLIADNCKEDVTVNQAPNYAITIDGAEKTFKGTITVDGKSARYETTALTIKNVNFDATEGITYDACVRLGNGTKATRYVDNVTVESCTFTDNDYSSVAVKSYTGGDRNLVVKDCEANGMHSLAQLKNIEQGLVISGNTANTKNGINLNQTAVGTIEGNEINVKGYAVRIGESTGGNITLNENTLKTDNTEGDPVIELRGTVVALNMEKNVVSGNTHIKGTAGTISVDANYWDGKEAPVVAEGSAPIVVNSYYSDATLSTLVRNKMGSIYAFVSSDRIFGDVTTNAKESIKIEIIGKDGNVIGTSSLQDLSYATGFNKQLTWRINLGDDDSDSWAMAWNEGAPSINNMPAKVKLYVDDAAVAEAEIKYTANGDGQSPVFAAKTNAEGKINSFIACTGEYNLNNAANKLVSASADGDNIAILVAGTYNLPTGKNLTITGAVDGVQFGPITEPNMGMKNYTFNNVTFNYAADSHYKGLQYAGNMVYNNCTFNGQVFLYGNKETFNGCTFNQENSAYYNVWTYSAKEVAFNECTFNSAGKSVLIYHEGATTFNDVAVTKCEFNASQTVDGKAAIEMDSHRTAGINLTIDAATTANGFGSGNVSGNSLWNNKMGNNNDANNDITVVVAGVTVLEPVYVAKTGEEGHRTLQEAINKVENGETITLLADCAEAITFTQTKDVSFVLDGNDKTYTGSINITARAGKDAPSTLVIKNFNFVTDKTSHDFIKSVETNYYPNNITIQDCTFKGTSDINTEGYAVVAVRLKSANNIKIERCTGTGLHSFLQNTAGWNFTIDNVYVDGAAEGGLALGTVQGVTVKNCEFNSGRYGIRLDGQLNNDAVIESNKINAYIPVIARKATFKLENVNFTFSGENVMEQTNDDDVWFVIENGNSGYHNGNVSLEELDPATGKVSVTLTDENLNPSGIHGVVAMKGNVCYPTLQAAIDAATAGDNTINLLADVNENVTVSQVEGINIVIDGKNYQFNGTIYIEGNSRNTGEETLTIQNVNFYTEKPDHDFIASDFRLEECVNPDEVIRYAHNVTVKDCNFATFEENENNTVVGLRLRQAYDIAVENCTSNYIFSLMWSAAVDDLALNNVTVEHCTEGITISGASKDVTITGSNITSPSFGIRASVEGGQFTMTNSTIDALVPVVVRNDNGITNLDQYNLSFTFDETNNITENNPTDYWFVAGETEYKGTSEEMPTAPKGNIIVNLNDNGLSYDGVYGNFAVAKIGDVQYLTLEAAATASKDGETIELLWKEGDAPISMAATFVGNKTVTITGTANVDWSKGFFFVGRNGEDDGKVIFDNANLTSGSNSTAYGFNVSGSKVDDNTTNNGIVEIKNSTIVLDYMLNKNVITLDNSTLTVKNGFSVTGREASESATGEDATATMTLSNNSKVVVNNMNGMGIGHEAYGIMNIDATSTFETTQNFNISAKGTMNVNGGNVKVAGTLTNAGTVYVTGAANLDANVTGNGWFYMNGVALDADTKLLGAKVGFINGENNIVGSTIDNGFFSVGIGQNDAATAAAAFATANEITLGSVTVNVSENAIIGGNGESYSGWVGSAYSADKTQHTYTLNVENSLAAFGYMHVSKDGIMNIDGRSADDNKYTYDNANVNFYAGNFIVNGNVTINDADAWVRYTKMSPDHADGVLNITGDTKYESSIHNGGTTGTSLVFYKAGKVNIAKETTIEIDNATTLVDGAELNIASSNVIAKGAVTDNGTINLTDLDAKFTAQEGLTVNNGVEGNTDYGVTYVNGAYQFAQYVAQIGDEKYLTLQEAVEAVLEDETIVLLGDITFTTGVNGSTNGISYTRGVNFTLDLSGKTITSDLGGNALRFKIGDGNDITNTEVTINVKNGKVVSGSNNWCAISAATADNSGNNLILNLTDLEVDANKAGDFAIKSWAGAVVNTNNVDVISSYAGGFYACGGEIVLDENSSVNQEGLHTQPYMSYAFGVSSNGKMTINGGTYSAVPAAATDAYNQGTSHGSAVGGVMSSGGTLIINGGTFSNDNFGDNSLATAARYLIYADAKGDLQINGGTFNALKGIIDNTTNTGADVATVTLKGGTYSANPKPIYNGDAAIPAGYSVVNNGNGTYSVVEDQVAKIGDVTYKLLHEAFNAAQDGDEIVVLKDITYTKANGYVNVNSDYIDGLVYTGDKSFTVDFGGYTITDNGEINDYLVYLKNQGEKDNEITFKNGTIAIKAERTNTAWAAITVGANSATYKTTLNLNDMEVVNGNPNKANNQVIRTRNGATVNLNNETVVTSNGTSYGVVAETGSIVNINSRAKVVHTNSLGTTGGNLVYTAVSGNGTINIYDGAIIESDRYAIHNMTSGNTVINIYGGTITAPVAVRVATNGGGDESAVANISGGTFTGSLETYTDAASIVISGGIFSEEPSAGFIADNYGAFPYDETSWVVREISGEQTFDLIAGWNWVSSYITEFNGTDGLAMLQEGLGTNGIQIKNDNYTSNYRNNVWGGRLTSVSVEEMYKVNMSYDVKFKFEGSFVNYDTCEIVLRPGWNYIGYPVNVETNLADALVILSADGEPEPIGANTNDVLKSQDFTSLYFGSELGWFGDVNTLVPGEGYMYKNTSNKAKILRYTTKEATTTTETNIRSSKHWTVDATQYPSNMTMIAMTDVEGGNYEVAAFVNGEVRGSARPIYIEELDAYILILTISGDDVEEMTFKCYDLTTGEEVEFSNRINYSNDAIVGSANEPYMLTRGTTGIGEAAISNVNIYPNPTTTGTEINLEATCDKVEVFNALGVKVAEYRNVDSIDALETAGIYVIRITDNGNVQNCRLVVK